MRDIWHAGFLWCKHHESWVESDTNLDSRSPRGGLEGAAWGWTGRDRVAARADSESTVNLRRSVVEPDRRVNGWVMVGKRGRVL